MIHKIKNNIWRMCFKEFGSCVYLLKLNKNILIDTSSKEAENELMTDLKTLNIAPEEIDSVILTHSHWDHIGNLSLFSRAQIYSYTNLEELNQDFPEFKIIETPGHTRDSICILYQDILFSGDTIFHGDFVGRTDFPESDPEKMEESLEKLKKIRYIYLCPGHLT